MKCPSCSLENPPSALRCDCGYTFPSSVQKAMTDPAAVSHLRSIDASLLTIKRILLVWIFLAILWIIIFVLRSR
jgi:hypothetical protein